MTTNDSKALKLVTYVIDKAVNGLPGMSSARELANEYINDPSYTNNTQRIDSLINWECSKNFGSGLVTSIGGFLTLPAGVVGSLGASWVIQARMAAAIAIMKNHNINEDRVRTLVALALIGDSAKEVLKEVGVKISQKVTKNLIMKIPGKLVIAINKKIGFRLLTKAGEKGVINLIKVVPFFGGLASGSIDAIACKTTGKTAQLIFA